MEVVAKTFRGLRVNDFPEAERLTFERCIFSGGSLGALARRPEQRLHVRDVVGRKCTVDSVVVGPVLFDEVEVADLRTTDHLWLPGCAFRHCTLRGRIGRVLILAEANPAERMSSMGNASFFSENLKVHESGGWALDISEAEFVEWDCRGVPAQFVRVDPAKQLKVSYEKTQRSFASGVLGAAGEDLLFDIEWSLKHREETRFDFVLATHPRHRHYKRMMELFAFLRGEGLSLE